MPGGVIANPDDLFSPKSKKVKGLQFDRSKVDDSPGNYMIHNYEGRTFYQEIGEDFYWDSPQKLTKINPLTLKPFSDQPAPETEKEDVQPEEKPEPVAIFKTKEQVREELMGIKYHKLRTMFEITQEHMMKKEELVNKIMEKLGYGCTDSTDADQPGD